jgi:hypothetical protein
LKEGLNVRKESWMKWEKGLMRKSVKISNEKRVKVKNGERS